MTAAGNPINAGFISRVQNILIKPRAEWGVIEGESASIPSLFLGYACVLALIPAIATIIGGLGGLLVHGAGGVAGSLIATLVGAVLTYALELGAAFLLGVIINALATSFGGRSNPIQAMKVAVYGLTAGWVAHILGFIPVLGFLLWLVGFGYTCYLIYLGVVRLMKPPADKAVAYGVVSIVVLILLTAVAVWIGVLIGALLLAIH